MRILFFDDSTLRHDFFCLKEHERHHYVHTCQHGTKYTVDHAYTASQAIMLLKKNIYDIIYLDHDMFFSKDTSPDNNGRTVAHFLASIKDITFHGPVIQIHSWAGSNAVLMYNILKDAGWDVNIAPFPVG